MMSHAAFGQSLPFDAVVAKFATTAVLNNHLFRVIRHAATVADFATVGVVRCREVFQAGRVMSDIEGYCHLVVSDEWLQAYTHEVA